MIDFVKWYSFCQNYVCSLLLTSSYGKLLSVVTVVLCSAFCVGQGSIPSQVQVTAKGVKLNGILVEATVAGLPFSKKTKCDGLVFFDLESYADYKDISFQVQYNGRIVATRDDDLLKFIDNGLSIPLNSLDSKIVALLDCRKVPPIDESKRRTEVKKKIDRVGEVLAQERPNKINHNQKELDSLNKMILEQRDTIRVLREQKIIAKEEADSLNKKLFEYELEVSEFKLLKIKKLQKAKFSWAPKIYNKIRYNRARFIDDTRYLFISIEDLDKDVSIRDSLHLQIEYVYMEPVIRTRIDGNGNRIRTKPRTLPRKNIVRVISFKIGDIKQPIKIDKLKFGQKNPVAICCRLQFGKLRNYIDEKYILVGRRGRYRAASSYSFNLDSLGG